MTGPKKKSIVSIFIYIPNPNLHSKSIPEIENWCEKNRNIARMVRNPY